MPSSLVPFTQDYLEEMLFQRTWRPAWEQALSRAAFVETFRSAIPRVEAIVPSTMWVGLARFSS